MTKQTYRITDQTIDFILDAISQQPTDGSIEVVIKPHKESVRDIQHRLIRHWCNYLGKEIGDKAQYYYDLFKYDWVLPVMLDNELDIPEEERLYTKLHLFAQSSKEARRKLCIFLSHKDLNMEQMRGAIDNFDKQWAKRGYCLPKKKDEYYEAMGLNR
jgi:hypothetical protein